MGTFAFGQKAMPTVEGEKGYIADKVLKTDVLKRTSMSKKDRVSGWYGYVDATLKLEVAEYTFYNNMSIFPDSTVKQIYGATGGGQVLGSVGLHGVGQVFDPKSAYFDDEEAETKPLSRYNRYTWDSVALFYSNYQHHVPGSVDTLIFQFYTTRSQGIQVGDLTNGEQTAFTAYNRSTNLGNGAVKTYKYLLDEKDTTTDRIAAITVPVEIDVPANGLAAFTISYRPGYAYNAGDTLDSRWTNPAVTKKLNHLRLMVGRDMAKPEHESYNHGLRLITATRYALPGNGWNNAYIPGDAWNDYNEHLYSTFHITSNNVGIENDAFAGYGIGNIYPNPASGIANLQFELGKSEQVTINVYNAVGQKVSTVANGSFAAGKHNVNFSVENLNSGIYFYTINAGAYSKTMKFTVVK